QEARRVPAPRRRRVGERHGDHARRGRPARRPRDDPARELRADDAEGRPRDAAPRPGFRCGRRRLPGLRRPDVDLARARHDQAVGVEMRPLLVLLAALALVPTALAGGAATPGVTATTITIGGTVPITGPAALFGSIGRGADAYFKYVNARGGVNGRKVKYIYLDDAYDPPKTV